MKRLFITYLLVLLPFEAGAQPFTNWPTYMSSPITNWPKAADYDALVTDLTWIHNALVERCHVADESTNNLSPLSGGTRWPKDDIVRFKTKASSLIADFVRTNAAVDGSFNEYFGTTNQAGYYYSDFPMWDGPSVRGEIGLPNNYLLYTPSRCLNTLGPFTNDPTVGQGHGWTNSYTALGGANFPGARANWYTTDYGSWGLKEMMGLLVWTEMFGALDVVAISANTNQPWAAIYVSLESPPADWQDLANAMEGKWGDWVYDDSDNIEATYYWNGWQWWGLGSGDPITMEFGPACLMRQFYELTGSQTNYARASQIYNCEWNPAYCRDLDIFGIRGSDPEGVYKLWSQFEETENATVAESEPINSVLNIGTVTNMDGLMVGQQVSDFPMVLLQWDGANGLQYK